MVSFKPLADRVVVSAITSDGVSPGGILLPDTAKEKPQQGEVVAVGPGRLLENGTLTPMAVKVGDRVYYSKYSGSEVKLPDQDLVVLRYEDIFGVIETT